MNTLGDSGDSNALCSAVRSVTCLCSIVYTGTDQGWLLFVQAELSGAHFILELPATATTTKSTFTIDLVVILQLSHQSLWSNSKCTWMMQIWSCHISLLGEKRKSKQTNKRNIHMHIHKTNSVICFKKKKKKKNCFSSFFCTAISGASGVTCSILLLFANLCDFTSCVVDTDVSRLIIFLCDHKRLPGTNSGLIP